MGQASIIIFHALYSIALPQKYSNSHQNIKRAALHISLHPAKSRRYRVIRSTSSKKRRVQSERWVSAIISPTISILSAVIGQKDSCIFFDQQEYNNFLKKPMQISQQNIKRQELKVPDPVYHARIEFDDDGKQVGYKDCWEISVLRFLHLLFGQEGTIDQERLTKYMDPSDPHCHSLIAYFRQNPTYHYDCKSYQTQQGFLIRANWAQFLNKCGLLDVKLEGKYEVKATFNNLIRFYTGFFPKLTLKLEDVRPMTLDNSVSLEIFKQYEKALNSVYSELSLRHKISTEIQAFCADGNMNRLCYQANQKISVDGQYILEWVITQFYNIVEKQLDSRIRGHSDYRYRE